MLVFLPTHPPPPWASSTALLLSPKSPGSWAPHQGGLHRGPVSPQGGGTPRVAPCAVTIPITILSLCGHWVCPPAGLGTSCHPPRRRSLLLVKVTSPVSPFLLFCPLFHHLFYSLKERQPMSCSRTMDLLLDDIFTCLLSGSSRKKENKGTAPSGSPPASQHPAECPTPTTCSLNVPQVQE